MDWANSWSMMGLPYKRLGHIYILSDGWATLLPHFNASAHHGITHSDELARSVG